MPIPSRVSAVVLAIVLVGSFVLFWVNVGIGGALAAAALMMAIGLGALLGLVYKGVVKK